MEMRPREAGSRLDFHIAKMTDVQSDLSAREQMAKAIDLQQLHTNTVATNCTIYK